MRRTKKPCPDTLPMFTPDSDWAAPNMASLPAWSEGKRVAVDVETYDPNLKDTGPSVRTGGFVAGVSFAIEDGPCHYLPIRHLNGGNLDEQMVLLYLKEQARSFRGTIVGANLSYDLDYLAQEGVVFRNAEWFRDVQIAAPLLYALHDSYSLQNIATRLGLPGKEEAKLEEAAHVFNVSPKSGLWKLPAQYVGAYAEQDARLPLHVLRRLETEIDENELWGIYDLESRLLPILVKMRRRGVRVDLDELERIEKWSLDETLKALAIIRRETGAALTPDDVWKARALAPVLESRGIRVGQTPKGHPEITKESLGASDDIVAAALLRARSVAKLRTTFAESIRRYEVNGRIHCTFNQIARETEGGYMRGGRFGRMSCTDPNLQQQPARGEFKGMWRKIYVPEEGTTWACCDYSQQEPRWATHLAYMTGQPGAAEAVERYNKDPKTDNHTMMAELTGLPRDDAKQIFLGICYGEGGAKLCRQLGLPTRFAASIGMEYEIKYFETRREALVAAQGGRVWEAAGEAGQQILDTFNERVPFIRGLAKYAERAAKRRGWVKTVGGRVIHFPQREDGTYDWSYKALNRVVQGTSADQMKAAMVALDRELPEFYLQLQVHDEVDGSVVDSKVAHKAAEIMADVMKASLPFRVDVELGPSWGEIKKDA